MMNNQMIMKMRISWDIVDNNLMYFRLEPKYVFESVILSIKSETYYYWFITLRLLPYNKNRVGCAIKIHTFKSIQ